MNEKKALILCGLAAGAVNGLFGAGGGMVLVPLLTLLTDLPPEQIFPTSVSMILPICGVSLLARVLLAGTLPFGTALPYLLGGIAGGALSVVLEKRIPVTWLHRVFGILVLWGGIRYLC